MAELIVAIAELLGAAGVVAHCRNLSPAPVFVSTWVACLAFALFGVLFGGLFAVFLGPWHPAVSFAVAFLILLAVYAIALLFGANPGFSLTKRAISSYAISFLLGAACLFLLFHRVG